MAWVKICGITNLEDALTAVEAGADALGFVFYAKSARNIDREMARDIISKLPKHVERVGVFLNESVNHIDETVQQAGLTAVQLYGGECVVGFTEHVRTQKTVSGGPKVISAIPAEQLVDGGVFIAKDLKDALHALLIDSGTTGSPGGSGQRFDWEKTKGAVEMLGFLLPTIIAGGLNEANVVHAIEMFQPWGVDVSSGVELKPGKKDPTKVRDFISAVRRTERVV
jgi:phosphoribosylanthranilate isomerase